MPEFIRPKRAIVETGGSDWLGLILALAALTAVVAVAVVLFSFVVAHAVLLGSCLLAFVVVVGGLAVVWGVRYREREPLPLPRGWSAAADRQLGNQRAALDAPPLALPAARPALRPAQHLHLHFHGVTLEDAAAITEASRRDAR